MGDWRGDLCREAYAAVQRVDLGAVERLYDPECEWHVGFASAALGETTYHGLDGVRALMRDVREVFPDWHPQIEELRLRADGALLVHSRAAGTARDSALALEIPAMGQVIEFRERRIVRLLQTQFPPPGWDEAEPLSES
jgi:hypothetical protein